MCVCVWVCVCRFLLGNVYYDNFYGLLVVTNAHALFVLTNLHELHVVTNVVINVLFSYKYRFCKCHRSWNILYLSRLNACVLYNEIELYIGIYMTQVQTLKC